MVDIGNPAISSPQWKGIYFDICNNSVPTTEECEAYFTIYFDRECNVRRAIRRLGLGERDIVDQNLFSALGRFFQSKDNPVLTECMMLCTAKCCRCKVLRPTQNFLVHGDNTLSPNCCTCRTAPLVNTNVRRAFYMIDIDSCEYATLDKLIQVHTENVSVAKRLNIPVEGLIWSSNFSNPTFNETCSSDDRDTCQRKFLEKLRAVERYAYVQNGGTPTRKCFTCSVSFRPQKPVHERKRVRVSKHVHRCNGSVVFSYQKAKLTIRIRHKSHHNREGEQRHGLSEGLQKRIAELSKFGMSPSQIATVIRAEGSELALYDDVYNVWVDAIATRFRKHNDSKVSSRLYLGESAELVESFHQETPFALGIITKLGQEIVSKWRIQEVYLDTAFKTERLEMVAVLISCMGTNFPLAFFILECGIGCDRRAREEALTSFLQNLSVRLPTFRPPFFFTNVDKIQITAVQNSFHIQPSLCFWHVKHEIEKKLKEASQKGQTSLSSDAQGRLISLMVTHCFRSTLFLGHTGSELYERAKLELDDFFEGLGEDEISQYLNGSWYDAVNWGLWGQRHLDKVYISGRTRLAEAHWSMLKRLYLLPYKWPRFDLILYVLDVVIMKKNWKEYSDLKLGLKKPLWWQAFVKEWGMCQKKDRDSSYATNGPGFHCTCPTWLASHYFVCNHLVAGRRCPGYNRVTINRSPPFVVVSGESRRLRAAIDNEEILHVTDYEGSQGPTNVPISMTLTMPMITNPITTVPLTMPMNVPVNVPVTNVNNNSSNTNNDNVVVNGVNGHQTNIVNNGRALTAVPIAPRMPPPPPDTGTKVEECVSWLMSHVQELNQNVRGQAQIRYINSQLIPRIQRYREAVMTSQTISRNQRTGRRNPDTASLP